MDFANICSRRKFYEKSQGKTRLCLLAALTAEGVQPARAAGLVSGSTRDMGGQM